MIAALLADLFLLLHVLFVAFVVLGLAGILVGGARGWRWVRNLRFRLAHLAAIGIVVAQAWLGVVCPLTDLEMFFRQRAGDATYSGSFVAHWLGELLYFEAPPWVFVAAYSAFGAVVALSWFVVRPHSRARPAP
jgi:hypothetical protein